MHAGPIRRRDARPLHRTLNQIKNFLEFWIPHDFSAFQQKLTKTQGKMPLLVKADDHELCLVQDVCQLGITHERMDVGYGLRLGGVSGIFSSFLTTPVFKYPGRADSEVDLVLRASPAGALFKPFTDGPPFAPYLVFRQNVRFLSSFQCSLCNFESLPPVFIEWLVSSCHL